jgi:hypothetical protein
MSDTIDAAAQSAIKPDRARNADSTDQSAPSVPAHDLVRLAQGFYFVFWGLIVSVLTGAPLLLPIEVPRFAEAFLGAGVGATVVGSWRLYQVQSLGERWHSRMRVVFALAALLTYFCVFFYLWRRVPTSSYLLGNALAFAATGILYVTTFNQAVASLATALGRNDINREAKVLSVSNAGLLLLPFVGLIAYLVCMAVVHKNSPLVELQWLFDRANILIIIVLLLPFSLTLSLAWSCKDTVLHLLAALDGAREPGSGPS